MLHFLATAMGVRVTSERLRGASAIACFSSFVLLAIGCEGSLKQTSLDGGTPLEASTLPSDAGGETPDAQISDRDASSPLDAGAIADSGQATGCGSTLATPIRTLFIGNSQIDFWNMARLVSSLSESANANCPRIMGERYTLGGANLRDLWEQSLPDGRRLPTTIAGGNYDVIVITESIDLAEFVPAPFPAQFVDYATRIIEASRAAGATPILYASPYIERADRRGFHGQADPQIELGRELGVTVATGGLAWLRVWEELPTVDLYYRDRQHPGWKGSYISALVIYSAITGATPIGLTRMPVSQCEDGFCPPISEIEADVFQRAAWEEVQAR
jgi:hypothetical protein